MSYDYTNGDGLSALDVNRPDPDAEPVAMFPAAIQQIKRYLKDSIAGPQVPTGTIVAFAGATPPAGWLLCNGDTVSQTTYAGLYAVIGATYTAGDTPPGGEFRLPNLSRRVPVGAGSGWNRGDRGGDEEVVLTEAQIPAHSHQYGPIIRHGVIDVTTVNDGLRAVMNPWGDRLTEETGGGEAHPNMPPYLILHYIIKT